MARRKTQRKSKRTYKRNDTRRHKRRGGNNGVYVGTSRMFTQEELKDCRGTAEGCNPQD